jgi:glutamyl-tRNA(Gln) amidotransferase subunit E
MRIGFEIHQQLDTRKLFCDCPSKLREDEPSYNYLRRLRPTQSELGEIDEAALKEFLKGKAYMYQGYSDSTCLVEIDEEPPHSPNSEAIDIAIEVALLLNAEVVDEVHFMRKLVIDGSNTSGFQRTAIIALNGSLKLDGCELRIPTICLEEEAARKIAEKGRHTIYRLDRLGIPLVEISTAPDITTPAMAREAALKIGELLRSTGKVKRGLGTIRQDINVSVEGGARVEIKGVQDLNQIPRIIEKEAARQRMLIKVKEELHSRGVSKKELEFAPSEVGEALRSSKSKLVKQGLRKGAALALVLPGFGGLLKGKLGPELAQHASVASGVAGVIHSDELPGYGISDKEVRALKDLLEIRGEDAFVLCLAGRATAERALRAVYERALKAFDGVPEETRVARQDGSTSYMRPLPGAARMYPETDIPPIAITPERIRRIKASLPESYEAKQLRYVREYGLSEEQAVQMVRSAYAAVFEELVKETKIQPSIAASTLLSTLKELKREGYVFDVSANKDTLREIFLLVAEGGIAKEALPEVIAAVAANPGVRLQVLVKRIGAEGVTEEEIRSFIKRLLKEKEAFVRERGVQAVKPLMGLLMRELRGRADGGLVNRLLREELEKFL